jgi:hypothetical protein
MISGVFAFYTPGKVLTVCREPIDGCKLNRCTRVLDARAADMADLVLRNKQSALPEQQRTASRFDAFTQLRIHQHLLTLSCTNGEYERMPIDGGHSDVFYYLTGGGARYPYPKEVWTPAGALDELRRFAHSCFMPILHHRWLVDETFKLEGKYNYLVRRNTCGIIRCLDC